MANLHFQLIVDITKLLKKPFDVIYCLYRMKQSHWLLCEAKNCDWLRKIAPLSNLTRANENLQRKQNWTAKCKKCQVLVIRAARWAEKLGCCPEYCRSWILAVAVNIGGYSIRVLHERSISTSFLDLQPLLKIITTNFRFFEPCSFVLQNNETVKLETRKPLPI